MERCGVGTADRASASPQYDASPKRRDLLRQSERPKAAVNWVKLCRGAAFALLTFGDEVRFAAAFFAGKCMKGKLPGQLAIQFCRLSCN